MFIITFIHVYAVLDAATHNQITFASLFEKNVSIQNLTFEVKHFGAK